MYWIGFFVVAMIWGFFFWKAAQSRGHTLRQHFATPDGKAFKIMLVGLLALGLIVAAIEMYRGGA